MNWIQKVENSNLSGTEKKWLIRDIESLLTESRKETLEEVLELVDTASIPEIKEVIEQKLKD